MKKRDRQGAEQEHARPVKYGLHDGTMCRNMCPGNPFWPRLAATVVMISALSWLAGCSERVPEGQVLVVLDDTEVTMRELQEAMKGQGGLATSQNTALEGLVARKILSHEAERRGLQSSGDFHFAMRAAREALLVRALRSDVDHKLAASFDDAVEGDLLARPWLYGERFVVTLQREGTPDELVVIDSASFSTEPPEPLLGARQGDVIVFEGDRWSVFGRRAAAAPVTEQRVQARQLLRQRAVDSELEGILENYRQSGGIRYQKGWGAASEGTR